MGDVDGRRRKHRDNLADQLGAPLYGPAPAPPYIGLAEGMIYASFAIDPDRAGPLLPPGLTLAPTRSAILVIVPSPAIGWGIRDTVSIWPAIMVNEMPSPDTAEAGYVPLALAKGPPCDLLHRHYMPTDPGSALIRAEGDLIHAEAMHNGRIVLRLGLRLTGPDSADMCSQDRYIGRNAAGDLVHHVVSASGRCTAAQLLTLEFTADAPPSWQAMRPTALHFALWIPQMLFNKSIPRPVLPSGPDEGSRASREALLAILDRQGRGCALLNASAQVLHANPAALAILSRLSPGGVRRLLLPSPADQTRLIQALSQAAATGALSTLILPDAEGRLTLLQIAPVDPILAGPGTALVVLDVPQSARPAARTEILQLLSLTPGEARIAAAVGGGLPPREAAARLGLAESTVRSALKVIFDKLGIRRQAELVQIVARLDAC